MLQMLYVRASEQKRFLDIRRFTNKNYYYFIIITIYGELATGHCDRGIPRKRYKDTFKRSIAACMVDHRQWTTQSTNRMNWRRTIY